MAAIRNVVIADKNGALVASLRRTLRRLEWKIATTTNFDQGRELVAREPPSLVIAGLRDVAGQDGVAFLDHVRLVHPGATRLLLADDPGHGQVMQGLAQGVVHDVIPIPWSNETLRDVLVRAMRRTVEVQQRADLSQLLSRIGPLPAQPIMYERVRRELAKGVRASVPRLGELLLLDPAMTAEILRVANAAIYGQQQRVDTVQRALVVLGLELAAHMVLLFSVYQTMPPRVEEVSYTDFWTHSLAVGLAASYIQARRVSDSRLVERAMVGGLLHDLGKLAFAHFLPRDYAAVLAAVAAGQGSLAEAEAQKLGVSHAELGGLLAEQWSLPPSVVAVIRWHHDPPASGKYELFVSMVQHADALVRKADLGFSGNLEPPQVALAARARPLLPDAGIAFVEQQLLTFGTTGEFRLAWG